MAKLKVISCLSKFDVLHEASFKLEESVLKSMTFNIVKRANFRKAHALGTALVIARWSYREET